MVAIRLCKCTPALVVYPGKLSYLPQVLAFSLLSIVLGADTYQNWLKHLKNKGYVKHFIESINTDNQNLMLGLSADNIKPLFVYEAKLVMRCDFTRGIL